MNNEAFDMKGWLDREVVPLLKGRGLKIYHPFWSGNPPKEVLVILVADPVATGAASWPDAVKSLLEQEAFRFDYLREQVGIVMEGGAMFKAFGGDGAPLFNQEGTASVRLFRKCEDGVGLVLQVGCRYPSGELASQATKDFYALFEESPLTVCKTYGAVFGAA